MLPFSFLLITLISRLNGDTLYRDEECVRLRRPFHLLTEEERMLYVNGYQALRRNGKLDTLSQAHAANVAVHKGASFFFFHAYIIWEAETAIRSLGDEYKCFSMPYWDYTIDSGSERDPLIFHLNVGGNGNNKNDFCMDDILWSTANYWSTDADTCMNDEQRDPPKCCLKRSISDTQLLPNVMQIASVYLKNNNFLLFETQIDHYHVWPHFYLAVNTWSQMATAYAVDDPLFFLLHTFTLYQRALWTSCYEYDKIDIEKLQNYRDAYTPSCNPNMYECGVVGIDAKYNLYPLNEADWSLASKMDITPRKLYNIKDWNVKYDLGTFYTRSKLNEWCEFKAIHSNKYGPNPEWFVDGVSQISDDEKNSINYNDLQEYIDNTWNELKSKQKELNLNNDEIYYAVESLSCKYHRLKSENSCYDIEDDIINNNKYETCKSRNIFNQNDITLDDMLSFDGVKENKCLIKRRKQLYSVSNLDDSIKLGLCNGDYDYKCPDWEHPALDKELLQIGKLKYIQYNNNIAIILSALFIAICLIIKYCWYYNNNNNNIKNKQEDTQYGTFV